MNLNRRPVSDTAIPLLATRPTGMKKRVSASSFGQECSRHLYSKQPKTGHRTGTHRQETG